MVKSVRVFLLIFVSLVQTKKSTTGHELAKWSVGADPDLWIINGLKASNTEYYKTITG